MNNRYGSLNELITANNIFEHADAIEDALNLTPGILTETFKPKLRLQSITNQLNAIFYANIDTYDNSIISATFDDTNNQLLSDFIDNKRKPLKSTLENIFLSLDQRRKQYIDEHDAYLAQQFQHVLDYLNQSDKELDEVKANVQGVIDQINHESELIVAAFGNTKTLNNLFKQLRADILKTSNEVAEFRKGILPQPEPNKVSIHDKHPILIRALIGTLVGVALVAVVAVTLGIMVATGGAAAAAITTFAGLMAANLGTVGAALMTAAAGLVAIGFGTLIGALVGKHHQIQMESAAKPAPLSTSKILKHVRFAENTKSSPAPTATLPAVAAVAHPTRPINNDPEIHYSPRSARK